MFDRSLFDLIKVFDFLFVLVFAGLLLNVTANKLNDFITPSVLKMGWLILAIYVTVRLMTIDIVQKKLNALLGSSVLSYVVVGTIGAAVAVTYWTVINRVFSASGSVATQRTEAGAIEGLSQLGWTVKPGVDSIEFEIASKPVPSMKDSAPYFNVLQKPFTLHFQSVKNLEGLHELAHIPTCKTIEINAGEFLDLSELRLFSHLTKLTISQTPISGLGTVDATPLSELVSLQELNLTYTKITNLDALTKLVRLRTLNLRETLIRDISPLSGMSALESLDITGTVVTDLSPLLKTVELNEIGVGAKQVADLGKLKQLGKLKSLRIIEQSVFDMSPIGELTYLENLFIWGPPLFDLSPLRRLSRLEDVHLSGLGFGATSQVLDIEALGRLKRLRILTLGQLQVSDLSFVSGLSELTEINLGEMPIKSIAPLRGLKSLQNVALNMTPVDDISPLLDLPALVSLSVIRTPVRADTLTELERRGVKIQR